MTGKKFTITGMVFEIISDQGNKWQTRNITTGDTILFDKATLERALRLGQAVLQE